MPSMNRLIMGDSECYRRVCQLRIGPLRRSVHCTGPLGALLEGTRAHRCRIDQQCCTYSGE